MAAKKERVKEASSIDDADDVVTQKDADEPQVDEKQPTPEETIEQLKAQIADKDSAIEKERARAETAERERHASDNKVKTAEVDAVTTRESAYVLAIDKTKGDLESAKRELKEALAGGDTDAVVEAQDKINDARYHLNRIGDEKKVFEKWKETQSKVTSKENNGVSPKAQEWIDEHPQFNTNKRYKAVAIAAHEEAIEKGCRADSKAYFDHIDGALEEMGFGTNSTARSDDKSIRKQAAASSVAAPASHETAETAKRGRTRTLTPSQLEAAEICGMTPGEYAQQLDAEEKRR